VSEAQAGDQRQGISGPVLRSRHVDVDGLDSSRGSAICAATYYTVRQHSLSYFTYANCGDWVQYSTEFCKMMHWVKTGMCWTDRKRMWYCWSPRQDARPDRNERFCETGPFWSDEVAAQTYVPGGLTPLKLSSSLLPQSPRWSGSLFFFPLLVRSTLLCLLIPLFTRIPFPI
jgi:hypothetical protein